MPSEQVESTERQRVVYEDLIYAEAENIQLQARCYRSETRNGRGIVMVHGGAWTANDRTTPWFVCESLARQGLTVLSLDFRCGPQHKHPAASSDVVAGIRFLKMHADEFQIDADSIGLIGSSSGGHLVLYAGLNHQREDHQATVVRNLSDEFVSASAMSAEPAYIVALWPVSDPTFRYQYAKDVGRSDLVKAHEGYFGSYTAMQEASVQRTLDQGETTDPPPVLIVQPGEDANVPEPMTLELLRALQDRNAEIVYRYLPGLPHAFAYQASAASERCCSYIWQFIANQIDK